MDRNSDDLSPATKPRDLGRLTEDELEQSLVALVRSERGRTADVIEHLRELSGRRPVFERHGYTSLYRYCRGFLGYSEGGAYKRARTARLAGLFPQIIPLLRSGRIHLEALVLLRPYLTPPNADELLAAASGLGKRDVEELVARRFGKPLPKRDVIIPGRSEPSSESQPPGSLPFDASVASPPSAAAPAMAPPPPPKPPSRPAPEPIREYRFAFTADAEFRALVQRAQALLRHKFPDGRLGGVLKDALRLLVARKDPLYRAERRRAGEDPWRRARRPGPG